MAGYVERDAAPSQADCDCAVAAAENAARAAGVTIRELSSLAEFEAVYHLYDLIWRPEPENPPITTELLRALTKSGNYVAGAFAGDQLLGAGVGFFEAPAAGALHSHIAGVSAEARGRSVGFALKLHQRAWALLRGVSTIAWTFDPLAARNAYFNLVKLGAVPVEYLPDFYGGIRDQLNGVDDTDRLLVRWQLLTPRVVAACGGTVSPAHAKSELSDGAVVALGRSEHGNPVPGSTDAATLLVAIPPNIEALRADDPGRAAEWRTALRDVLGGLLTGSARVVGFDPSGWYVLSTAAAATPKETDR